MSEIKISSVEEAIRFLEDNSQIVLEILHGSLSEELQSYQYWLNLAMNQLGEQTFRDIFSSDSL